LGIGVSVFLVAVGAILTWAVHITTTGIDLGVVGVILMVVGFVGLLFSLLFWTSFAPFARDRETVRETEFVDHSHRHVA
jgi:hypothetical protein